MNHSATAHRGILLATIMLATILQALDSTIAAVALPHMQGTFSATQEQVAWVLTSYIVASAITTPMAGFLAGRLGRKRLYLLAVGGFTVTSMLCGVATSLEEMVLFRVLQGVFGAPLIPVAQATLLDNFPPQRQGSAMAMFGMGVMLGPILGPTLGAYLTEYYDWRWVFFINAPLGALALAGIQYGLHETRGSKERPFDYLGFAFLGIAIAAFQLMLDRGNTQSWFQSTEIVIEGLVALVCLYMFIVHVLTRVHPFIDPHVFRDRNLTMGMLLTFMTGINFLAVMALMPPFLQKLLGYPVLTTGWVLAPRGLGTMIAMGLVSRLVGRVDVRLLLLNGLLISATSLWWMSTFDKNVAFSALVWSGLMQGFGLGFLFVPTNTVTFATLPAHLRTEASGLYGLVRNVGSSIGVSILTGLLGGYAQRNHSYLVEHINPFAPALSDPGVAAMMNPADPGGLTTLNGIVTQEATMLAYVQDFRMMAAITLLSLPLLLFIKPAPRLPVPGSPGTMPQEA
jgi:DHA2 family multidrug resistance protein